LGTTGSNYLPKWGSTTNILEEIQGLVAKLNLLNHVLKIKPGEMVVSRKELRPSVSPPDKADRNEHITERLSEIPQIIFQRNPELLHLARQHKTRLNSARARPRTHSPF
jgi:hypothetical protein